MVGLLIIINDMNKPIDLDRLRTFKTTTYPVLIMTIIYLIYTVGVSLDSVNYPRLLIYYVVLVTINWLLALIVKYYDKQTETILKTVSSSIGFFVIIVLCYSVYLNYTGQDVSASNKENKGVKVVNIPEDSEQKRKEIESLVANGKFTQYCTDDTVSKFIPSCHGEYVDYLESLYTNINEGSFPDELNYREQELTFINTELDEINTKLLFLNDLQNQLGVGEIEANKKVSTNISTLTESYNQLTNEYNKKVDIVEALKELAIHNYNYMVALGWVGEEQYKAVETPIQEFTSLEKFDMVAYVTGYTSVLPLQEKSLVWVQNKIKALQEGFVYEKEETQSEVESEVEEQPTTGTVEVKPNTQVEGQQPTTEPVTEQQATEQVQQPKEEVKSNQTNKAEEQKQNERVKQ